MLVQMLVLIFPSYRIICSGTALGGTLPADQDSTVLADDRWKPQWHFLSETIINL
jgi:hypothetical protein